MTRLVSVWTRKDSLVEKFIDDAIPSEITQEECVLEEKIRDASTISDETLEHFELAVLFVRTAHDLFRRGNAETRQKLVGIVASNIGIRDRNIAHSSHFTFC